MKWIRNIAALVLMMPILAIMVHNFVPHHHHDYCIDDHTKFTCEHNTDHHHHDKHHTECEDCDRYHSHGDKAHDVDCHVHLVYKVEKNQIDQGPAFFAVEMAPLPEMGIFLPLYQEMPDNDPDVFFCFLRGPPLVKNQLEQLLA